MGILQEVFHSGPLQPAHRRALISAFDAFTPYICREPWDEGRILQQNIEKDVLTTSEMAEAFWKCLDGLLSQLHGGSAPEISCCNPHREKVRKLLVDWTTSTENPAHALLHDLMEVTYLMARPARWCIGSSVSAPPGEMELVRFMELRGFLRNHYASRYRKPTNRTDLTELEQDLVRRLDPKFPPAVRMAALERSPLGLPSGSIGALSDSSGGTCRESTIPFATPAEDVDRIRALPIENVLRKLGVPFHADEYFVEIRYSAEDCKPDGGAAHALAVPAFPDACSQPFWWPCPDTGDGAGPRFNRTREIPQNACGLKELLHLPVSPDKAILSVWPKPTKTGWRDI